MSPFAPLNTTRPARSRAPMERRRPSSRPQTYAASPYGVSLAMRTASSSESYGSRHSTGPKISSRAMVMSLRTLENTVGRT
jgi:hypothetical protein